MNRSSVTLALTAGMMLLACAPLAAQAPSAGPLFFNIDGGAVHQADSDLKDGGGSFEVDRWFVSGGMTYAWDRRTSLGFTVGGGQSKYVFDPESGFGEADPWDKVLDFRLSATYRFKVSETATGIIIPTVRFSGESGADSGDSSTYGLFAAVFWQINENLTIGPGVGVFSRLDNGSRIFPVLAIDWNISERWNLGTGRGLAASQGPGLTLGFKASEHWTVAISGRYEDIEFRLDDDGQAANGIGRDQSFPIVVSGVLKPNPKTTFSLFTGLELGGSLRLKDEFGEVVDESDYDPALIIGATFGLTF